MKKLEDLIQEIRKQLLPFSLEHDVDRGSERWGVGDEDCLSAWILTQMSNCRQRNRCSKKGECVYYGYSDLARKNYRICREIALLIENGEIGCRYVEKEGKK